MAEHFCRGRFGAWRARAVKQGGGGLDVDDAFAQKGEAVIEALPGVVERFVGYCEPLSLMLVEFVYVCLLEIGDVP